MTDQDTVWDLTLQLYDVEGVQSACLQLQDELGVGVSALLTVMILGFSGEPPFTAPVMKQALKRATDWQQTVIEPLRAVRRGLREASPADQSEAVEALRKALLSQEIAAEKIQQALICQDAPESKWPCQSRSDCMINAHTNALMYLACIGKARNKKAAEPLLQRLVEALAKI